MTPDIPVKQQRSSRRARERHDTPDLLILHCEPGTAESPAPAQIEDLLARVVQHGRFGRRVHVVVARDVLLHLDGPPDWWLEEAGRAVGADIHSRVQERGPYPGTPWPPPRASDAPTVRCPDSGR